MMIIASPKRCLLPVLGLLVAASAIAAPGDPGEELDLSLRLDARQLEEIVVTAEPWREPRREDDEWRPKTRTWETGRITWGYDSAYEAMNAERDSRLYFSPSPVDETLPTSTLFRVRF